MLIELLKIIKEPIEYRFKKDGKFTYPAPSPQNATIELAQWGFISDGIKLPIKGTVYKFNVKSTSKTSIAYELCEQIKQKYPEFYL